MTVRCLTPMQKDYVAEDFYFGMTKTAIAESFGVSRRTVGRVLQELGPLYAETEPTATQHQSIDQQQQKQNDHELFHQYPLDLRGGAISTSQESVS